MEGEETGRSEGEETEIREYCMREEFIFSFKKKFLSSESYITQETDFWGFFGSVKFTFRGSGLLDNSLQCFWNTNF